MKLLPDDQEALQEALRAISDAHDACANPPDTSALRQRLQALGIATTRALVLTREAEDRARNAALKALETVA